MNEPTPEHIAEAHRIATATFIEDFGAAPLEQAIARALAAVEERGFELGFARGMEKEEQKIASLRAFYSDKLGMGDPKACWDDILTAAVTTGFERGFVRGLQRDPLPLKEPR